MIFLEKPKRKPTRLPGYDYSNANYYYVTICTNRKEHIFGEVGKYSKYGLLAESELENIKNHFENVHIDKYVIMPNHVHAIIALGDGNTPSLTTIVGLYKSGVSRKLREMSCGINVWQRSFYDEVIRNEEQYFRIWRYIDENPLKWQEDEYMR